MTSTWKQNVVEFKEVKVRCGVKRLERDHLISTAVQAICRPVTKKFVLIKCRLTREMKQFFLCLFATISPVFIRFLKLLPIKTSFQNFYHPELIQFVIIGNRVAGGQTGKRMIIRWSYWICRFSNVQLVHHKYSWLVVDFDVFEMYLVLFSFPISHNWLVRGGGELINK